MTDFKQFPEYDEVHVISDIHMGGKPGFQILRETKRLAGYIGWVAEQAPEEKVALILNGDVFDTLAEDIEDIKGYVAIDDAVDTFKRIMNDEFFIVIWDALAEFVAKDQRTLIFVIGNHDIEMAFPTVQRLIIWQLAGDDLLKSARIVFSTTGAGYTCTVGDAKVYCTHGNEVDPWNQNSYEDLAKVSCRLNADPGNGLHHEEWRPNAGTRMVKEVMNKVKKKYKWIDFLKPETTAAVGTLWVLDPSQESKITDIASIMGTMGLRSIQGKFNLLSAEGFKPHEQVEISPPTIDQLLGPNLRAGIRIQQNKPSESVDGMLLEAEKQLGKSSALVADPEETLGGKRLFLDKIVRSITGESKEESLRRALQDWSADDYNYNDNYKDIFNHDYKDNAYMQVVAAVGDHITFIVTGHTHLERAIEIKKDQFYFNCGTWIRLLRFTDAMLKNTASFEPVYKLLANDQGSMKIIDDAEFPDAGGNQMPFVLDQTSAVSIKKEDGKIVGRLNHIEGNGTGKPNEIKKFEKALT